jgi:serine/threonine-protein kinase
VAIIYAHLQEDPPRPSEVRAELPRGIDAVIAKALDKRPERRFQTCSDLMSAAQAVMEESGPLADPPFPRRSTPPERPSQPGGRHVPPEGDPSDIRTLVPGMNPGLLPPDIAAPPSNPANPTPPPAPPSSPSGPTSDPAERESTPTDFALRGRARVLLAGLPPTTAAVARVALARCDVEEAGPSDDVLMLAREQRPDLVLMDWAGAGRPAGQLVRALRDDAVTRDTQVMLVVDWRQASTREVAEAGADDHLAAPFSPLQLQVKLRKLLGADIAAG